MRHGWFLIAGLTCLSFTGCSRSPRITVRNQSPQTVSNLVVSGTGFTERLDRLASGAEHTFRVRPSGESGVSLGFDAGNQHVQSSADGYFEASGGSRIQATIGTNLTVSVESAP